MQGGQQHRLPRALADALVPHASPADSAVPSYERAAWMQCLYSGTGDSSSDGSESLRARFERVQQLLQRQASHAGVGGWVDE